MELTEQQKQHICAELARAMGWDFIASSSEIALPGDGEWYTPFGRAYGNEPPDPFTDAAASRALLIWLGQQSDAIMDMFANGLMLSLKETCDAAKSGDGVFWGNEIIALMTAPLEAIVQAACAALGIEWKSV